MIAKDGHMEIFNPNLGCVIGILNSSNDFGRSHRIVYCTIGICIM
jgi:hypothetical protein